MALGRGLSCLSLDFLMWRASTRFSSDHVYGVLGTMPDPRSSGRAHVGPLLLMFTASATFAYFPALDTSVRRAKPSAIPPVGCAQKLQSQCSFSPLCLLCSLKVFLLLLFSAESPRELHQSQGSQPLLHCSPSALRFCGLSLCRRLLPWRNHPCEAMGA